MTQWSRRVQWGNKEREESLEQKAIRAMWECQDQEGPLDSKGPQVSRVSRASEDPAEREDLK